VLKWLISYWIIRGVLVDDCDGIMDPQVICSTVGPVHLGYYSASRKELQLWYKSAIKSQVGAARVTVNVGHPELLRELERWIKTFRNKIKQFQRDSCIVDSTLARIESHHPRLKAALNDNSENYKNYGKIRLEEKGSHR